MTTLKKEIKSYIVDNEAEAAQRVEECKAGQLEGGYTMTKSKVDYKVKKDRKTGDITEEYWVVELTMAYEL